MNFLTLKGELRLSSNLTKLTLTTFIFLSFLICNHSFSKDIKKHLTFFEKKVIFLRNFISQRYSPNSIKTYKRKRPLTSEEIWRKEISLFRKKYRLDKKQGEIVLSFLKKTYPDAPYMLYIARCESDQLVHWKNRKTNELIKRPGGSDSGVLQVNGIHKEDLKKMGLDLSKTEDYFTFTRYLYDKKGVGPWYMSKSCWNKDYQRIKSYI